MPKHVDMANLEADGGESYNDYIEKAPIVCHSLVT